MPANVDPILHPSVAVKHCNSPAFVPISNHVMPTETGQAKRAGISIRAWSDRNLPHSLSKSFAFCNKHPLRFNGHD